MIKPVYNPENYEYQFTDFQEWSVRPKNDPGLAAAYQARNRLRGVAHAEEKSKVYELQRKEDLTAEETEFLKERDPDMWWTDVIKRPYRDEAGVCILRCGCGGEVVRVGSNFRIPKQKDEMAWKEIERMIAEGIDMDAKFSCCPTVEEYKRMVESALDVQKAEQ